MPHIQLNLNIFNAAVRPFSDVFNTGRLIHQYYKGRTAKLCYRPDINRRVITDRNSSAINLHLPSNIRSFQGDPTPWLNFLKYLFPVERERREVERWCATLIARPEVRMLYGLLLVSERQGMGKSTLGERILAPLVGLHNTGFPGERDIVESGFNGWAANKRLVVVGEIYTGQSFKAYNILKSYVTDKNINVNEKFQRPYTVDNWIHIVACSNSKKALRIEDTDRRWYYPQVAENPWTEDRWADFYDWLNAGGLPVIRHWAETYEDYVKTGQHSPMTVSKQALIKEGKGEILNSWHDIMEAIEEPGDPVALSLNEVVEVMRRRHGSGRFYETALAFKKEALSRGWSDPEVRMTIQGAKSHIILSPAVNYDVSAHDSEKRELVRRWLRSLADILSPQIANGGT